MTSRPSCRLQTFVSIVGVDVACILLIISILCLVNDGYGAAKVAKGADPDDFAAVGRRCRIEGIDYHAITGVTSTSDGGKTYHCDERWDYTFVVLEVEDVLDIETEAEYFGLRSITEERVACKQKSCGRCNRLWGKDHVYNGQPIVDGYYAIECWALKEGVVAHQFWSCSESNIANDSACYLLSNPSEVLQDQLKYANRSIMIGWILLALGVLSGAATCCLRIYATTNEENEDAD